MYNAPAPTILDSTRVYKSALSIGSDTIKTNPVKNKNTNEINLIIAAMLYINSLVFGKFMWLYVSND
jgi:hypothetical protein